jgi:hypothetical protein
MFLKSLKSLKSSKSSILSMLFYTTFHFKTLRRYMLAIHFHQAPKFTVGTNKALKKKWTPTTCRIAQR